MHPCQYLVATSSHNHLLQLIPKDQSHLSHHHSHEHHEQNSLHKCNLGIHFVEAEDGLSIKALPGGTKTKHLRAKLSAKGAVNGNDALVLLGKQACLDTPKSSVCRNNEEDDVEECSKPDEACLRQNGGTYSRAHIAKLARVTNVLFKPEEVCQDERCHNGNLFNGGSDECWAGELAESSPGRDATVEALLGGIGDDEVGPCGVEAAQQRGCDDRDDGAGDDGVGNESQEEAVEGVEGKTIDGENMDGTEAREEARPGAKVLDG